MDDGGIHRMSDATEFRSVTYRLHPGTRARHVNLAQVAGACRYVWNHFLACNRRDYATYKLRKPMFDAGLLVEKPSPPSLSFQSMGVRFRGETPIKGIEPERVPPIAQHALPGRAAAQPDSLFTLKVDSSIYS